MLIAQIVGVAAVVLALLSFQLKERKQLVFVVCVSNFLYVLQYCLLGAFSGAVLDLLSTISSFFATKKNNPGFRRYAKCMAVTISLSIVAAGLVLAIFQKSYIELLPIAGALFQTVGLWFQKEQTIRKFTLAGAPFWLIYNFICRAYGAAVGAFLTIISIIIALLRYRKLYSEPEKTEESFGPCNANA